MTAGPLPVSGRVLPVPPSSPGPEGSWELFGAARPVPYIDIGTSRGTARYGSCPARRPYIGGLWHSRDCHASPSAGLSASLAGVSARAEQPDLYGVPLVPFQGRFFPLVEVGVAVGCERRVAGIEPRPVQLKHEAEGQHQATYAACRDSRDYRPRRQ